MFKKSLMINYEKKIIFLLQIFFLLIENKSFNKIPEIF